MKNRQTPIQKKNNSYIEDQKPGNKSPFKIYNWEKIPSGLISLKRNWNKIYGK